MEQKTQNYYVSTFYCFQKLSDLDQVKNDLISVANELGIIGLWIIGPEGFNTTSAAPSTESLDKFKNFVLNYFGITNLMFKDSTSHIKPFLRFTVKIRQEIVTLNTPDLIPQMTKNHHLTPTEWNKIIKEENPIIIDTRNWYEYNIGTFKGALNPDIDVFTEFPEYVKQSDLPKDKKILIFCTGGIRCEKGIMDIQRQGFDNVYHLEGGIIKYLEEYPNDQFEGECFVFDHRVALNQELKPSETYKLCPHCGQPAAQLINCKRCDTEAKICVDCYKIEYKRDTCSKNCAHQYELHPNKKGKRQIPNWQQVEGN